MTKMIQCISPVDGRVYAERPALTLAEAEMAVALRRIIGLHLRAQDGLMHDERVRRVFCLFQHAVEFFRRDIVAARKAVAHVGKQGGKFLQLQRIRRFMHAVNACAFVFQDEFRRGHVRRNHKKLDQLVAFQRRLGSDALHVAAVIERDFIFRERNGQRAATVAFALQRFISGV